MQVHTKTERRFNPHLFLLQGAQYHLRLAKAKTKTDIRCYDWLGAILFSALSIEAIGNSYGKVLIANWRNFERNSPQAKLGLVATQCGIKPDFEKQPWQTATRLITFRNNIAHAKPQALNEERDCSLTDSFFYTKLESDLEKMITEKFATQSCDAVDQIIKILNKTLKDKELYELTRSGHEYCAQIVP